MKRFRSIGFGLLLAGAFILTASTAGYSQETMMRKVGDAVKTGADKTVSGTKTGVRKARRVGTTIGNRTWTGSKWIASKSWKGGKWVAVKTVNGTKWVYRKATGRRTVRRP